MSVTHECFLCWAADETSCGCNSLGYVDVVEPPYGTETDGSGEERFED